jgi:hypothetical protein
MFPGLTRPSADTTQSASTVSVSPPSYNIVHTPPSYGIDAQQQNNGGLSLNVNSGSAAAGGSAAQTGISQLSYSYPNLSPTAPNDSSVAPPPAYTTSSSLFVQLAAQEPFSDPSSAAAISSPATLASPLQQNSSSNLFSQPMEMHSSPLGLPSLGGSVIVSSPAPGTHFLSYWQLF